MTLEAIKYRRGQLDILDQLLLPSQSTYISIHDTNDAWHAIKKMQVACVSFSFMNFGHYRYSQQIIHIHDIVNICSIEKDIVHEVYSAAWSSHRHIVGWCRGTRHIIIFCPTRDV